ncbi:MAG TPA: ABC transporter substrate-binding protein [Acidobacteriota bacterium]|nr:ABC transporter substrate-binding protein [Acidobacteriota bacterium]
MRAAKYFLLMVGVLLTLAGCGEKKKEIKTAAESMEKNKVVRIVTDAVNAPFEFGSGTGVQGYDVDLGNEIAKDLGIEPKWVKATGYDHLFELLKGGEAEMIISAIAEDPAKSKDFSFSTPYYQSGDAIALQRSTFDIKDLASLSGKKVGVATGRPGDTFMAQQKTAKNVTIKKYPTMDDALGALNRAEIGAVVGDEPFITYSSYKSYSNTTTLPILINKFKYAVVVRSSEPELLAKINATIARLQAAGEFKKYEETWFGNVRKEAQGQREKDVEEERLKKAPKAISVSIQKISGAFSMDRLDGFVLVLDSPQGKYQSTPILTDGNRGNCKFTQPVPPGEYRLNMSIFKMVTTVKVPDLSKSALAMDMKVSTGGISITLK